MANGSFILLQLPLLKMDCNPKWSKWLVCSSKLTLVEDGLQSQMTGLVLLHLPLLRMDYI